jgi:hypothetical protein
MWYVVIFACASSTGPAPVLDCPALWVRQLPDFESSTACDISKRRWQELGYDAHCVNTNMPRPK